MPYFDPTYFDPDYFDAGDQGGPTGFIPRGSMAAVAGPSLPTATVVVPSMSTTVALPSLPEAEVD